MADDKKVVKKAAAKKPAAKKAASKKNTVSVINIVITCWRGI
jgi:hypothetical protein